MRQSVVAGQFYPGQKNALEKTLKEFLAHGNPQPVLGVIAPHAGYIYSGAIAGQVFAETRVPQKVIILGNNHHGYGHPAAIFPSGSWVTPLGETPVDEDLSRRLRERCVLLAEDAVAHEPEHSLEVQLPFIQACSPHASIVPICIGQNPLVDLLTIGRAIGDVVSEAPEDILLVASTDMTHYESAHDARKKDHLAIRKIEELDPEGLYRVVVEKGISMCGVMPVVVLLAAVKRLKANSARLVGYATSGDVTGDHSEVVGYAGLTVQ